MYRRMFILCFSISLLFRVFVDIIKKMYDEVNICKPIPVTNPIPALYGFRPCCRAVPWLHVERPQRGPDETTDGLAPDWVFAVAAAGVHALISQLLEESCSKGSSGRHTIDPHATPEY